MPVNRKEVGTMAKSKRAIKCRNYMYEQQIAHLPNNMTPDEIYAHVEQNIKPKKMACIVHDKDLKDDNKTPAEAHIHMMLQFENERSLNQLAKDIGDNPQQLESWKGRVENGFSYLIHATDNARHKHQYSVDEVTANFDYADLIKRTAKKVTKTSNIVKENTANSLLDLVGAGEMTLMEAKKQLTGSDYAKLADKLKKAHELYLERSAEKLHKQMVENNEIVSVHWFYGQSECGKTYLAEILAKEMGTAYYKTTTTTDPFQFYQAEQIIILDELRPEVISYSELLALLNPFSRGKVAVSSRYFNKALSCKTIFITTPYNPIEFYRGYHSNRMDKGEQLYRRLSSVLELNMDWILKMEYQDNHYVEVDRKPNNYSKKNQTPYTMNNVFDCIN